MHNYLDDLLEMCKKTPTVDKPIGMLLSESLWLLLWKNVCVFSVDQDMEIVIKNGSLSNKEELYFEIQKSDLFRQLKLKYKKFCIHFACHDDWTISITLE